MFKIIRWIFKGLGAAIILWCIYATFALGFIYVLVSAKRAEEALIAKDKAAGIYRYVGTYRSY